MKRRYHRKEIEDFTSHRLFDEDVILKKDASYPKISIITPSYNQSQFLEKTILSVLNQNYPNLDYIVIDGGSMDESVDIIRKYEDYLSFWISEKDDGQADAINRGFKLAQGDLIAWQNSDDIYLPNSFLEVATTVKNNPAVDLVFGNILLIDKSDLVIKEMRFVPFLVDHLLYAGWNLSSQAAFWSRRLMNAAGPLKNTDVLFDFDWFIRLGGISRKVKFKRKFLGCYRIHGKSKFSLISQESRWPVFFEILKEHNIKIKRDVAWNKQFRRKKFKVLFRKVLYHIIQGESGYLVGAFLRKLKRFCQTSLEK
jgi:glycosyltransferase involved in cell wall biosynthesis